MGRLVGGRYGGIRREPYPIYRYAEKLSLKTQKVPDRSEKLWLECRGYRTICSCNPLLESDRDWSTRLRPNSRNCRLLRRLLRQDDRETDPCLTWSRQDLVKALIGRRIQLSKVTTRCACRAALYAADQDFRFRFMDLPIEIRTIVYEEALHLVQAQDAQSNLPLLATNCQIKAEALNVFFRITRPDIRLEKSHHPEGISVPDCMNDSPTQFYWILAPKALLRSATSQP
ncbi:hypothetical protein E4T38_06172 [Aureobasidium subglaciale]|nr:hypothetical protein E4T38_06172 [Aureobasidium subglaciale]KAI5219855.1 hypothetical protein E4T40_06193 [Aureobasidium subglaciale]KAI5260519.1 hypothetical protein E4T46_05927 [Aureobasidium subglaciale]